MNRELEVIEAPCEIPVTDICINESATVFLAGSIEMGVAERWQDKVIELFRAETETGIVLLNPRRKDWDNSWEQSIDNEIFREQVEWELDAILSADAVLFYFDPKTKSPISLLELGLVAARSHYHTIIVVCPEGFYRKGNVDIICEFFPDIMQFDTLEESVKYLARPDED